jgi:pyruvate dehydrogenase (quinone)
MAQTARDGIWQMLVKAGIKHCNGIFGDALNPLIDALRRNGRIDFVHVRPDEYDVFAAIAEAYLTRNPVVGCGTHGPGVTHLFNGLMNARKEDAPVIAIDGDLEMKLIDTSALEILNPHKFFDAARHHVGRILKSRDPKPPYE